MTGQFANGLNRDGHRVPSARRPDQNRHRLADGWQGSTIRVRGASATPSVSDRYSDVGSPATCASMHI